MPKRAPEALAEFAETARETDKGKKVKKATTAQSHTAPKKNYSSKKQAAAKKVLKEGATGKKAGAMRAVKKLANRITGSR